MVAGLRGRVFLMSFLVLVASIGIAGLSSRDVSAYSIRAPILIDGDANFTSANGVTGGHGTVNDPYIISGWQISSYVAHGIEIHNTIAHFVVRDVLVQGGSSLHSGIRLESAFNGRIENATLTSNVIGLDVSFCRDIAVMNNTITHSTWGIFAYACSQIVLDNDSFSDNEYYGVLLKDSTYMSLNNNSFSGDGVSIDGFNMVCFNTHGIPQNNLVNGKPILYVRNQSDIDISNLAVGQLIVVNCQNGRISNVSTADTDVGIEVSYSSGISIEDCEASSCYQGLHVQYSSNMTLVRNRASYSNEGSRINDCERASVIGNSADYNQRGLILHTCGNFTARNNSLSSNDNAMEVYYGSNCAIVGNSISSTTFTSITLDFCKNLIVAENMIQDSWGIYLYSSEYVRIFHNSFVNLGFECKEELGGHNKWHGGYPLGGNYWAESGVSDSFVGPNQNVLGSDGMGDVPHVVNSETGIKDKYPLVSPWIHKGYLIASFYVSPQISNDTSETFHLDATSSVYLLSPSASPEVRWDWEGNGTWDVDWSLSKEADHQYSGPGIYSVSLEARVMNLTSTAYCAVCVDNTRPMIVFDWMNETIHSRHATIAWISTDSLSQVDHCEYSLDGGEWVPIAGNIGSVNLTGLGDGRHLLAVRAVDRAGNVEEANLSFVVNTSILSPGGPYGPWVLTALVLAIIAAVAMSLLYLRFRTRKRTS